MTYHGHIENGRVVLDETVTLPDGIKVLVTIPSENDRQAAHVRTPQLAHPKQVEDFVMDVEEAPDARL